MPESRTCRARAYEVAGEAKLNNEGPVYVTKPFLPPLDEFLPFLEEIWSTKILTNAGPFHRRLETELARFLGVEHLALVSNGTLGLVVALQALHITGEVITTPFSFAATAHSLIWNNLSPVFVDIEPNTLNLDPAKIEAAITPDTSAIMPVHCYGTPCKTDEIQRIADVYGLKVIYDAAHAFNVRVDDRSILAAGDLSVLSFHATKVFNTFEGGAIVCPDAKAKQRIDYLKNFGIADEVTVTAPGINAKMNEFQAALGLLQLKYADTAIEQRHTIALRYLEGLRGVKGITCLAERPGTTPNHSYFPILVDEAYPLTRDGLYAALKEEGVHSRRYFYPLISDMPMYRRLASADPANLTVAQRAANQVLCLPIYPELSFSACDMIIAEIRDASSSAPIQR